MVNSICTFTFDAKIRILYVTLIAMQSKVIFEPLNLLDLLDYFSSFRIFGMFVAPLEINDQELTELFEHKDWLLFSLLCPISADLIKHM